MAKGWLNIVIAGDASKLNKAIAQSERRMRKFGRNMQSIGDTVFRSIGVPFIAAGAAGVKAAMDFESSMSKIQGLVGITGQDFKDLESAALRLGPQMGKSANEAAEALFFITSAGLKGNDAIQTLQASLKASVAGLGETKVVADLATSAMNAYGSDTLSAAQATDVLTAAVREGKLEADTLAGSMGRVLPIASAMGVQFNEVGAAFAAMSRTGTNADEAATQLKAILTTIAKPAKESEKALNAMGLSSEGLQKQLQKEGLLSVLTTLSEKFKGNTAATAQVFGNVRALTGVLDLMGKNAAGTADIFERMNSNAGDTNKAFKAAAETTEFKFKVALAKLNAAAIDLGRYLIPIVTKAIGVFQNLISAYMNLDSGTKQSIINTLKWTTILSGSMSVIGRIITGLANLSRAARMLGLVKVFTGVVSKLKNVGAGLKNITKIFTPQGAIIAGMIVLTAAIIKNWDKVKTLIVKGVNYVIDLYNNTKLVRIAFEGIEMVGKNLISTFKYLWNLVKNIGSGLFGIVEGIVTLDTDKIKQSITDAISNIGNAGEDYLKELKDNFNDAKKDIENGKIEYITEEDVDKFIDRGKNMFGSLKDQYDKFVGLFSGGGGGGGGGGAIPEEARDRVAKLPTLPRRERDPLEGVTLFGTDIDIDEFLENRNKQLREHNELLKNMADMQLVAAEAGQKLGEQIVQLAITGQLSFRKLAQAAIESAGKIVRAKLIQAVVDYISSALQNFGIWGTVLAAGAGAVVGGLFDAAVANISGKKVPALAQGGVAFGPTMAMVGDNSGARVNPEVIAPLDKLKSMMGGNSVNVTGQFRIRGTDLVVVLERTNRQVVSERGYGLNE